MSTTNGAPTYADLWRRPDYLLGVAASLASGTAESVLFIALLARVYELTRSPMKLGVTGVVEALPALVLAPLAGLVLDRTDRRRVMLGASLFTFAAVMLLASAQTLPVMYLGVFLVAAGGAIFQPAIQSLQPSLLPKRLYLLGSVFSMTLQSLRQITAPALGGWLVCRLGFGAACHFAAAACLVSALATALIRKRAAGDGAKPATLGDLSAGFRVLLANDKLRFVVTFQSLVVFVMAMQAPLVYVFVQEVLHEGPGLAGTLFSSAGLGGILGGLAMGRWGGLVKDRLRLAMITLFFDGLVLLAFTLNTHVPAAIALFSMFGVIGTVNTIVFSTLLQEEVPDDVRGRVSGSLVPLYRSIDVASITLGTGVAAAVGVVPVFVTAAVAELAIALASSQLPSYRRAILKPGDSPDLPSTADLLAPLSSQ